MENLNLLFATHKDKYNNSVVLSRQDKLTGVKILSKEPYAQELYNFLSKGTTFSSTMFSKDLELDQIYTVILKGYNREERLVYAEEVESKTAVFIPLRELNIPEHDMGNNAVEIVQDAIVSKTEYKVMVYRKENNEILASERKCALIIFKQELEDNTVKNNWFTVKVTQLIDGGYIALYKNSIKCFLPGSQARANIISDFSQLIGQEVPVMIENFDSFNNLYIVSYKKYIKNTLAANAQTLKFGQKYSGVLTTKPLAFGIFVEWDNYFTGLIHQTDFEDYQSAIKNLKGGDQIDFYIKDIMISKGETRIVLTTKLELVNQTKLAWQELKDLAEGKTLEYVVDKDRGQLEVILPNNTSTYVTVDLKKVNHLIRKSTHIKVFKIDTLKQFIKFDFVI